MIFSNKIVALRRYVRLPQQEMFFPFRLRLKQRTLFWIRCPAHTRTKWVKTGICKNLTICRLYKSTTCKLTMCRLYKSTTCNLTVCVYKSTTCNLTMCRLPLDISVRLNITWLSSKWLIRILQILNLEFRILNFEWSLWSFVELQVSINRTYINA